MKLRKKKLENILKKLKHEDTDFSSHQGDWENFEQKNESILLTYINQSTIISEKTTCFC